MREALNISLPDSLRSWVLDQVEHGGFSSASEFVRHLLREEQKRQVQDFVDAKLRQGLASGPSIPMTDKQWEELRRDSRKASKPRPARRKR